MGSDPIAEIDDGLVETAAEIRQSLSDRRRINDRNPSGDSQLAVDVAADRQLEARMEEIDGIGMYASEERQNIIDVGDGYSVAVDPLDGSSNLRSNNTMGTIMAVYDEPLPAGADALEAAWFVLYGPITTIVGMADGSVTERVVVDGVVQEEVPVELPADPTVYGFGGRVPDWTPAFESFVEEIRQELKLRYGGAMVGDINQVISHGGIFSYPALQSAPRGKLRLQFEGIPMAAIVEAAGGASSDGERSLLAIEPESLHQRVPVHLGNRSLIDRLEAALA